MGEYRAETTKEVEMDQVQTKVLKYILRKTNFDCIFDAVNVLTNPKVWMWGWGDEALKRLAEFEGIKYDPHQHELRGDDWVVAALGDPRQTGGENWFVVVSRWEYWDPRLKFMGGYLNSTNVEFKYSIFRGPDQVVWARNAVSLEAALQEANHLWVSLLYGDEEHSYFVPDGTPWWVIDPGGLVGEWNPTN